MFPITAGLRNIPGSEATELRRPNRGIGYPIWPKPSTVFPWLSWQSRRLQSAIRNPQSAIVSRAGPQLRKENHVTNAFCASEQNAQSIDAYTHATGRWHAVLEGEQEVLVDVLLFLAGLFLEHLALGVRVVLLRIRRRDFHAADRQLEHVDRRRI